MPTKPRTRVQDLTEAIKREITSALEANSPSLEEFFLRHRPDFRLSSEEFAELKNNIESTTLDPRVRFMVFQHHPGRHNTGNYDLIRVYVVLAIRPTPKHRD